MEYELGIMLQAILEEQRQTRKAIQYLTTIMEIEEEKEEDNYNEEKLKQNGLNNDEDEAEAYKNTEFT